MSDFQRKNLPADIRLERPRGKAPQPEELKWAVVEPNGGTHRTAHIQFGISRIFVVVPVSPHNRRLLLLTSAVVLVICLRLGAAAVEHSNYWGFFISVFHTALVGVGTVWSLWHGPERQKTEDRPADPHPI